MRRTRKTINAPQIKDEIRNWYAFEGPSGEVVHNAKYFFAWREGVLVGTYKTLEEAMESLSGRDKVKARLSSNRKKST
jgi:hypothetical protein